MRRLRDRLANGERVSADDLVHYFDHVAIAAVDENPGMLGLSMETVRQLTQLRTALADAIRRPMGVIPDSAKGLITEADLDAAEKRRMG